MPIPSSRNPETNRLDRAVIAATTAVSIFLYQGESEARDAFERMQIDELDYLIDNLHGFYGLITDVYAKRAPVTKVIRQENDSSRHSGS